MNQSLQNLLKNVPVRLATPVDMNNPNDTIEIHSGEFRLKNDQHEFKVNGRIYFRWLPSMKVIFKATFIDQPTDDILLLEKFEVIVDGKETGKVRVTDLDLTGTPTCGGDGRHFIWGDSTISVSEVSFSIPNMREYLGSSVKETPTALNVQKARLTLDDKPYKITIDQLSGYKKKLKSLEENGGYLLTYAGKIEKEKGAITLSELHKWQDRFHHFLYFLNGRRVAPMFFSGMHNDEKIWTDYGGYTVDMHKFVPCWSDIFVMDDLSQLWKSYNKLWKEDLDKDFLITAIHWYVEANMNAGMVEGSIILIQTALELLYNWLIIENEKVIIGGDAEGMSAANKIRLLIHQFKIPSAIPEAFKELAKIKDVEDGPEAFVKIRNALVHGQKIKRNELKKISLHAKYEALQLGIWYVELGLLYVLGYKGKYNNRTDGNNWKNTGVLVPWVNDQIFKVGKPKDFGNDELESFLELLIRQNKVKNPTIAKLKSCKTLAIGYSWELPVSIGAIKKKTESDFGVKKADLPALAKEYEWEIGYFYTEPDFEGRKFSSAIMDRLLKDYNGKLMATTEIKEGNRMITSLESRLFKRMGKTWKSEINGNDLQLFLRGEVRKLSIDD
ncbi:HEPN domain-containing protein [Pedobacter rhodius]|uniref:HEPN domain-containing protein n=1 Tax=Pedobacter rhodius TaxID=3004098 RepID=A0ABT4KVX4_9SPHI|nr:HEPN domain-containing protein [Pedobacter sp. SJ11]MCZ4222901.1 HEPN domain-containing protein [Pedobacter sp. SJ11]